ncbi:MAG: hypothetical protein FWB85_02925 [Chitinispirillia bacterium]|nr:hypothetical protein [Chitinispirillia bacterium]
MNHIKLLLVVTLITVVFTGAGCNDSGPDPQTTPGNGGDVRLIGSWKLIKLWIFKDNTYETFDYSKKDIIYDFQKNGKLNIIGEMDYSSFFEDFKEGEHFYEHWVVTCSTECVCDIPGPIRNLRIDGQVEPEGHYFLALVDDETMGISGSKRIGWITDEFGKQIGENIYGFSQEFIKVE